MNKKFEEKILDEIRQRVIEKDRELKERKEEKGLKEATFEVLADMTSLSLSDVKKIEKSVREKFEWEKKQQRKKIAWLLSALVGVLIVVFVVSLMMKPPLEIVIEEDFDDNSNNWVTFNDYKYKYYIENNAYVFETNVDGWCYWDNVPLEFPKNYTIELVSRWHSGKYSSYGFSLLEDNDDYFAFMIRGDGAASFGKVMSGEWVIDDPWRNNKANSAEKNYINTQKLEVQKSRYKYFVNNNFVQEGYIDMPVSSIGLRSCGEQMVSFENIKIVNNETNDIVFNDHFEKPNGIWTPGEKFTKKAYFEDGNLIFTNNSEDCFWTYSSDLKLTKDAVISLKSKWVKGESAGYGLILFVNENTFVAAEYQSDGDARLVVYNYDDYTFIGDYKKSGFISTGNNIFIQKLELKDDIVSLFIDDKFIQKTEIDFSPQYMGLKMCGKQTVEFEHVTIKNYE